MSYSPWKYITAIMGLVLFATLGQAQEKARDEQGQATIQQRPVQTLPIPLPVDVIEDEAKAEARKRSEAESRQREIEALAAQQGMNTATQDMRDYALYSTVLVGIGTFLLMATLGLTWMANRAAQAAVKVTKESSERQLRAYVYPPLINHQKIYLDGNLAAWEFSIPWKNSGYTPAINTISFFNLAVVRGDEPEGFDFPDTEDAEYNKSLVAPFSEMVGGGVSVSVADMHDVANETSSILIWAWIDYDDVFPKTPRRRTEIAFKVTVRGNPDDESCQINCVADSRFLGMDDSCSRKPKPYEHYL